MNFRAATFLSILVCMLGGVLSADPAQGQGSAPVGTPTTTQAPPGPSAELSKKAKAASDAAKAVEAAVTAPKDYLAAAAKYQKSITDITGAAKKRTVSPLEDLQTIRATVQAIQQMGQKGLIDALTNAKNDLDTKNKVLDPACLAVPDQSTQKDVADAKTECTTAGPKATEALSNLTGAIKGLQEALGRIYKYLQTQESDLTGKVSPVATLAPPAPPSPAAPASPLASTPGAATPAPAKPEAADLFRILPTGLPALRQALDDNQQYKAIWDSTKTLLSGLIPDQGSAPPGGSATVPVSKDVDDAFDAFSGKVDSITPNLKDWFGILQTDLLTAATALDGKLAIVATDPAANSPAAVRAMRDLGDKITSIQPILDAWPPLVGFLVDRKPSNFVLQSARDAFESLQTEQIPLVARSPACTIRWGET